MDKRYDVGVVGVWFGLNYGSSITYYALQTYLKELGLSVLMIEKPNQSKEDIERLDTHARRFANDQFNISDPLPLSDFKKYNEVCNHFVVGSDQVWNYGISKGFGKIFYLDFVDDEKLKIACASSFGHAIDFAPDPERKIISGLMQRFNAIGVREDDGVTLCRDVYGVSATHVLDPIFIIDKNHYLDLAQRSKFKEENYFLAYVLDVTEEKKELLSHIAEKLGLRPVILLDGFSNSAEKNRKLLDMDKNIRLNIEVYDWLYLFSNASFVMTDSFHGTSFSLLFQKQFIALPNKRRGFSRFQSLARVFGIEDRLVFNCKEELRNEKFLKPLDYSVINEIHEQEAERCRKWLNDAFTHASEHVRTVNEKEKLSAISKSVYGTVPKDMCSGCSACENICPEDAVKLVPDEFGYFVRNVDEEKCINCGLCSKHCPALFLPENRNSALPDCYAFIAADEGLLYKSTSGGIFSTLAEIVLNNNGEVAGASWTEDFSVRHILIDTYADLHKLQKSKYMQSYIGTIYREIKNKLDNKVFILFSGTPCQIAGLKSYLHKEYDNLLLIDILCGNAPSQYFFKKYMRDTLPFHVKEYQFRYKSKDIHWGSQTVKIVDENDNEYVSDKMIQDDYQRVYHTHTMTSKHCELCKYQKAPRFGDISIGDFWGISNRNIADTKKGISLVLLNNEKGKEFFERISDDKIGFIRKVPLDWIGGNGYTIKNSKNWASPSRDKFYKVINKKKFSDAVNYALKPNLSFKKSLPALEKKIALQFNSFFTYFRFDPSIWTENYINKILTLSTIPNQPKPGNFASIPLYVQLKRASSYNLKIKFKLRTEAPTVNFHIKDSGSTNNQVIYSYKVEREKLGDWVELSVDFKPNSDLYDEFMIGASQIRGKENYIAFEYIYVVQ